VSPKNNRDVDDTEGEELSGDALTDAARAALLDARRDPQFGLYGRNIWIMKPACDLRGHGISVLSDLDKILGIANANKGRGQHKRSSGYVAQKYIENPLLIGGKRKHDIRQWVLVTSMNPMTIWFFNECYVRVAANDYSVDNLGDQFTHLTHTVIMAKHPNFDADDEYWRCQWDQATYQKILRKEFGSDVWTDKILPSMKRIVIASLLSVQEAMTREPSCSCCFQLVGYDFMVDSDLSVWLLEVNDIPMLHASGPVTERLCDACLSEVVGLALDGEQHCPASSLRFEQIYFGAKIAKPKLDALFALSVSGTRISRPEVLQPKAPGTEEVKAQQAFLNERRAQELEHLKEKRKSKEDRERQTRQREMRLKHILAEKVLRRHSSAPMC